MALRWPPQKPTSTRRLLAVTADHVVYAIDDTHGRADLSAPLLAALRVDPTPKTDRIVALGDEADRGAGVDEIALRSRPR